MFIRDEWLSKEELNHFLHPYTFHTMHLWAAGTELVRLDTDRDAQVRGCWEYVGVRLWCCCSNVVA